MNEFEYDLGNASALRKTDNNCISIDINIVIYNGSDNYNGKVLIGNVHLKTFFHFETLAFAPHLIRMSYRIHVIIIEIELIKME